MAENTAEPISGSAQIRTAPAAPANAPRVTSVRTERPLEEQVESAAAQIRPLLLDREEPHCVKAVNALLYFARAGGANDTTISALMQLREEWKVVASQQVRRSACEVRVKSGEAPDDALADHGLACAWMYGDVVHADLEKRKGAHSFRVEERFHAAAPLVVGIIVLRITMVRTLESWHG